MAKRPWTKNTVDARKFLESEGFEPLRFFQGKTYIYPLVSTVANRQESWQEYDYSTFDEKDDIHEDQESILNDFKIKVQALKKAKEAPNG